VFIENSPNPLYLKRGLQFPLWCMCITVLLSWAGGASGPTLQMKGRRESNINVWFPFMYSHKWNCALCNHLISKTEFKCSVSQLLISHLWEIYIFPGSVCVFFCSQICGNWDWGRAKEYIIGIFVAVHGKYSSNFYPRLKLPVLAKLAKASVHLGLYLRTPALTNQTMCPKLWVKRQIGKSRAWIENENR
jgi:hypothetical protein